MTTATGSAMPTAPPRLKPHELAELTTFGDILHLVHHRNLNQHRHSIWWRSFSVFRRELSHLLSEYATYQPPLAATTASVSKTSSKASKAAARRGAARLEAWKKERVPRWYLAFTEVISSTQFSAIGLVLLAVLARVTHLTGITAAYEEEAEHAMQAILREFAEKDAKELFGMVEGSEVGGRSKRGEDLGEVVRRREDLGEVVSREAESGETIKRREGDGEAVERREDGREAVVKQKAKKKERKARGDETTSASEVIPDAQAEMAKAKKKAKKEKRRVEPEPEVQEPPKKKKKAKKSKGSAIDDLFAGL